MTWIIPKTLLTTYPSVLDTKELGLDLEEFSQTCEKSLTLRGKDMSQRSWQRKWKKESWIQRLSTRMLKPSHTEDFLDKWISSLQVSPANPLVVLGNDNQPKTHDTYSPSSSKELNNVDQSLSSLKMSKASSPQKLKMEKVFSNMSSEVWSKWVTQQRQEYSQRLKSVQLTKGKEFTYWATPTSGMWKQDVGDQGQYAKRVKDKGYQVMLPAAVKLSQTTQVPPMNDNTLGKHQELSTPKYYLNPNWVEQLMGLNLGWTDLGFWATELSQQQPKEPLEFLRTG